MAESVGRPGIRLRMMSFAMPGGLRGSAHAHTWRAVALNINTQRGKWGDSSASAVSR